jgi:hypothetical protein
MPSFNEILTKFGFHKQSTSAPGYQFVAALGPAILLLFILFFALGREMFSGNVIGSTHFDNDLAYFIALRKFAFYSDSSFPLWNPYLMCGVPLIAEIQSGLFYPLNIFFRILPLDIAINISLFVHLYLLAIFTYCCGRQINISRVGAIIAASVFCFCGPVFLRLFVGHHSDLYSITWIPAVFLIVARIGNTPGRKNFIYLGLVFCLQILAGHTQYLYYTIFFSWLYLLFVTRHLLHRSLIRSWVLHNAGFLCSIGIALLIALPQVIPVYEMLSLSPRKSLDIGDVARFSFPPQNLLTFLTPLIFGDGVKIPYWGLYNLWEMCAYCGTMSLLLSAVAIKGFKRVNQGIFFLFLAVFALIMALGGHTPLLKLFYHILPGFKMFRGHSKTHIFCCFAIALLAGIGYDALRCFSIKKGRQFFLPLLGGLGLTLVLLLLIPYSELMEDPIKSFLAYVQNDQRSYLPIPGVENADFADAAVSQAVMSVRYFLISLFLGLCLIVLTLRFGSHWLLNTITILFILADLFIFGKTFVSSVDIHHWDLKPEALQFLVRDTDQYRSAIITSFGPKYGITSPLHQISGDYPYVLSRYSRLYNLANQGKPIPSMKLTAIRRLSPLYNLFNLKYLVVNSNRKLDIPGYEEVYDDGILSILQNNYAVHRVYLPRQIKMVKEENEALRSVLELPAISGEQIILESESASNISFDYGSLFHQKDPNDMVEIVAYRSNRIELRANLASDAWVVLADTFYSGWKAIIDDQFEAVIIPANYAFRAIYVPQGVHKIVFQYRPKFFAASIIIALITLLGSFTLAALFK